MATVVINETTRCPTDGIRVWPASDLKVCGGVKEVKLPSWAAITPGFVKDGVPIDVSVIRSALSPLADCFYKYTICEKKELHDEKRRAAAEATIDSFCTPVLNEHVYAYATSTYGERVVVTIPSSLFGVKPFSMKPWLVAIEKAVLDPRGVTRRPKAPPSNKRKAADDLQELDWKDDPELPKAPELLFNFPTFDEKIGNRSVQAAELFEKTALGVVPSADAAARRRAFVLYDAGLQVGAHINACVATGKAAPVDVFRVVVGQLKTTTADNFMPHPTYGTTAQHRVHLELEGLCAVNPNDFRLLVCLVATSRCTRESVDVLCQIKDSRAVAAMPPGDKQTFDAFVTHASEFVRCEYLTKSAAWKAVAAPPPPPPPSVADPDATVPIASAAAAPASQPMTAAVDMGSDPKAAEHVHCVEAQKGLLEAHAKIADEVVQITADRDKLRVTLSVKDETIKKLQAELASIRAGLSSGNSSATAIASSRAEVAEKKNARLERELKSARRVMSDAIQRLQDFVGAGGVDLT